MSTDSTTSSTSTSYEDLAKAAREKLLAAVKKTEERERLAISQVVVLENVEISPDSASICCGPGRVLLYNIGSVEGISRGSLPVSIACNGGASIFAVPIPGLSAAFLHNFCRTEGGYCINGCGYRTPPATRQYLSTTPTRWLKWTLDLARREKEWSSWEVTNLAAEFYALAYLETGANTKARCDMAKQRLDDLAQDAATRIVDYLFAACLGESRHALRIDSGTDTGGHDTHIRALFNLTGTTCKWCKWWMEKTRPTGVASGVEKREVLYLAKPPDWASKTEALAYLYELFATPILWQGSYGGPNWAQAAAVGKDANKISPRSVCDRVLNMCHNGGTIFSKTTMHWKVKDTVSLQLVLDTKSRAKNIGNFAQLLPWVSKNTLKLYKSVAYDDIKEGRPILWDGEARGRNG